MPWVRRVIGGGAVGFLVLLAGCMEVPGETSRFSTEVSARYPFRTGLRSASTAPSFPEGVDVLDGLDEEEAVRTALWNNAQFLEALSDLGLTRADVVAAEMIPNPTLSVLVPVGAKPFELVARYPLELLWLRPKRVALARMEHERNSERLVQVALDLIRDVRVGFAEVVLAHQQTALNGSLADLMKESATLAGSLTRAGEASEVESMVARNESHQAVERADRMRFDEAALRERLHLLLGLGMVPMPDLRLGDPPISLELPEPAEVLALALTNRPDLRASELAVEAAGRRIGLARNEALQLAATVSSKEVNGELMTGPGLDVTLPIFNRNNGKAPQIYSKSFLHSSTPHCCQCV
jgi:cobalt-zinc-cadmium efflux system outer membrane protein